MKMDDPQAPPIGTKGARKNPQKNRRAVATIMALDRAIRSGNDTSASVYDDCGILFI